MACLATFVLDSCGKSGIAKALSSPPMDKIQTFTRGDVVLKKGRGGKKKVNDNIYSVKKCLENSCVVNKYMHTIDEEACIHIHVIYMIFKKLQHLRKATQPKSQGTYLRWELNLRHSVFQAECSTTRATEVVQMAEF